MRNAFLTSRRFSLKREKSSLSGTGSVYKGIATSIIIAVVTAAIGYAVSFIDSRRKAQLKEIDAQIEKVYGPLYAYSVANRRAWLDLRKMSGRGTYFFNDQDMPNSEQVEIWRRWMKTIFMPNNLKMESAIVENAQLLDGGIYPCFEDLVSHVASYKATIAGWKDWDDLSQAKNRTVRANNAVIEYPRDLDSCVDARFQAALQRRSDIERSWLGMFDSESTPLFDQRCSGKRYGQWSPQSGH